MALVIDGYNVLYAVGILGRSVGPGSLERARLALLNFLAESLEPDDLPRTTVVFDASDAPPGVPNRLVHRGMTVLFATQQPDADTLIEDLIRHSPAPRQLTVVSSDRRIQRAARRRRATAVASDAWYTDLVRRRAERHKAAAEATERPHVPLLEEDVDYWIRQFGGESVLGDLLKAEDAARAADQPGPEGAETAADAPASDKPTPEEAAALGDVFPPGYAEELLEDEYLSSDEDQPGDEPERTPPDDTRPPPRRRR